MIRRLAIVVVVAYVARLVIRASVMLREDFGAFIDEEEAQTYLDTIAPPAARQGLYREVADHWDDVQRCGQLSRADVIRYVAERYAGGWIPPTPTGEPHA